MQQCPFLTKRTADSVYFDVYCGNLLDADEFITSVQPPIVEPLDDSNPITFGTPVINQAPVNYPFLGVTAAIGQAVQVLISGGDLPSGVSERFFTIRFPLTTNINPLKEATVTLRLYNGAC